MEPLLAVKKSCFPLSWKPSLKPSYFGSHFLNEKLIGLFPLHSVSSCEFLFRFFTKKTKQNSPKLTLCPPPTIHRWLWFPLYYHILIPPITYGEGGVLPPPPLNTPSIRGHRCPLSQGPLFWNPPCCNPTYKMKKQTFRLIGNTPYHFENYRITFSFRFFV